MSTQNYPETNLIKKENLARVREADFALMFGESVKKLVEALGITRKVPKQAGTVLKTYKATGSLQDGNVAEGDIIPLSQYATEAIIWGEMTLAKYRKSTSAEAIVDRGFDQAVSMTTSRMIKDVQKVIRKNFFDFLATGESYAGGSDLQATLASAWGKLQVKFEDDEIESVFFVHPEDIADYLGTASISTQTAFGMTYIENFLGLGTVFMNSSVPKGTVYATAKDNIVLYYIPVNGADLGEAFDFTSDELGYIGIHESSDYKTMTAEDVVVDGIRIFAERIDGVVVSLIDSTPSLGSLALTSADGTTSGDTKVTNATAKQDASDSYVYKVADSAVSVSYGEICKTSATGWKAWNGTDDITAASGKVITIVEIDSNKRAQASGNCNAHPKA